MTFREHWDAQADAWAAFARTPGEDQFHDAFNLPAFLELLPAPGRATLDVGCGEGRVGAELERRGHRVTGVDASPAMVELARDRHDAVVADAAALPFDDDAFDLVIAYMALMNMDDLDAVVGEIGRVLEPGGRLCTADIHPFNAGEFDGDAYRITGSYLEPEPKVFASGGVTFLDRPITLERYARAFEAAGLAIETLREPRPPAAFVEARPKVARRLRFPLLLHLRAVKR